MVDRYGKTLKIGDCVRYWHRVDGKPTLEIGQVSAIKSNPFRSNKKEAVIERREYNDTTVSYREANGITKITKEEATLWKLEH